MIGVTVTSKSWKGTCLIFSSARHASVSTADAGEAGRGRPRIARASWAAFIASPPCASSPPAGP